jgi:hypothetical protein
MLSDGARTWVVGHIAIRENTVTHGYDDKVFDRRQDEREAVEKYKEASRQAAARAADEQQKIATALNIKDKQYKAAAKALRRAALPSKAAREAASKQDASEHADNKQKEAALAAKERRTAARKKRKTASVRRV